MGGCLCRRKRDGRILLLGLDNAGKTSISYVKYHCVSDRLASRLVRYYHIYPMVVFSPYASYSAQVEAGR